MALTIVQQGMGGTGASSAAIAAGTGISVSGTFPNQTVTNSGVTSVTAGTGISVSASTGGVTISTSGSSGVTSVATGNGLSGGTITSTGTLVIACPSFNSVGSYVAASTSLYSPGSISAGGNVSAGSGDSQINIGGYFVACGVCYSTNGSISGTWKWMTKGATRNSGGGMSIYGIACRVA